MSFQRTFMQTCAWMPGMKGTTKLMKRVLSAQDTHDVAQSFARHQNQTMHRRRFSVMISSEENNRADHANFYGKYSHIRSTLDYNYHSNYTFERQKLQDAIITDMLDSAIIAGEDGKLGTVPTMPWIVFTAVRYGNPWWCFISFILCRMHNSQLRELSFVIRERWELAKVIP